MRDSVLPRNYKFTFDENGFYRTLKRRIAEKVDKLDRSPVKTSKLISDVMLVTVFTSAVLATSFESSFLAVLSGIFVFWQFVIAHNFFHQKDNWRMFCCNLSLFDYREWRVSHAMSHHLYTNSYYDLESTMFEPILCWLPHSKTWTKKITMTLTSPISYSIITTAAVIQRWNLFWLTKKNPRTPSFRTIGYITNEQKFQPDHLIPFSLPLVMFYLGKPEIILVLKLWAIINASCSFMVGLVGLNVGHHHPDVTHEGDEIEWVHLRFENFNQFWIKKLTNITSEVQTTSAFTRWTAWLTEVMLKAAISGL